jgi:hypothetical protein
LQPPNVHRLDPWRCGALKNNRVIAAKHILAAIVDIERALRARIDLLDGSAWGDRLNELVTSIAIVQAAGSRVPACITGRPELVCLAAGTVDRRRYRIGRVVHGRIARAAGHHERLTRR